MERAQLEDPFQDWETVPKILEQRRHVDVVSQEIKSVDSKDWFDALYHLPFYACHKNLPVYFFSVQQAKDNMFVRFNTDGSQTIFETWEGMYCAFLEQNGPLLEHERDHFSLWRLTGHEELSDP